MKTVKTPKGWRRLRAGERLIAGDSWLDWDNDLIEARCAIELKKRVLSDGTVKGYDDTAFYRRIKKRREGK